MNSENKKISVGKKEMRLFLDDKLYPSVADNPAAYDFEREFGKTRKNRSFELVLIMLGVTLLIGVGGYGFSRYIDKKNKNITVAIDAFEDLNLMKLLDRVTRTEAELDAARAEGNNLEARYQSDLQALQNRRDSELFTLNALNLSGAETARQKNAVNADYEAQRQTLAAAYTQKQQELADTITALNGQLADIDSANVQRAQEQQAAIDSQRQLFDLEKQQLVADYEAQLAAANDRLRSQQEENLQAQKKAVETVSAQYQRVIDQLDPVIKDERGSLILKQLQASAAAAAETGKAATTGGTDTAAVFSELQKFSLLEKESALVGDLQNAAADLRYVANFVTAVPQKNTVPAYARAMRDLGLAIAGDSAKLLAASFAQLEKERQQAARLGADLNASRQETADLQEKLAEYTRRAAELESYLVSVLNAAGDTGLVLDARDKQRLPVFISPLYESAAENAAAYIVNRSGDLVGQVTLVRENGHFYAVPAAGGTQDIKANDRILLQLVKN